VVDLKMSRARTSRVPGGPREVFFSCAAQAAGVILQ
jgi:hypothetical protein